MLVVFPSFFHYVFSKQQQQQQQKAKKWFYLRVTCFSGFVVDMRMRCLLES